MSEHFIIAVWARDSVIKGDIEGLRKPLRALVAYHYPTALPASWAANLAKLQDAAHVTAEASTLDAAASGVATMARVCGDCHVETSGLADLRLPRGKAAPKVDTLTKRMDRHIWAIDRMWIGLTGPSDEAWSTGAAALAHAPTKMKGGSSALPPNFQTLLSEVRALGVRAQQAKAPAERADVYGRALSTCAHCHALRAEVEF